MRIECYPRRYSVVKGVDMKSNFKSIISLAAIVSAVSLTNYCTAAVSGKVVVNPTPVMTPAFPNSYVWDGRQYVGLVGNQYYYLGPGNAWVMMDPARMNHFRGWSRANPNWRNRAIRNTRYRTMAPPPIVRPHQLPPPPTIRNGRRIY